jgi:hypothetical protein
LTTEDIIKKIDMTNEEIDKAIAEYCGWKYEFNGNDEAPEWYWIPPNNPDGNGTPPDYCNDLNAMRNVVNLLVSVKDQNSYISNIAEVCWSDFERKDNQVVFNQLTATPIQCAEAFLRTIHKWKD